MVGERTHGRSPPDDAFFSERVTPPHLAGTTLRPVQTDDEGGARTRAQNGLRGLGFAWRSLDWSRADEQHDIMDGFSAIDFRNLEVASP